MNATKALKASFGWQIRDCTKARIELDRWGFKGLDGKSLKDPSSGSQERVVCELWEPNNRAWDRDRNIWNNQNNAILHGKDEDATIVLDRAKALGDDFRIHNFTNALMIPMNPSEPYQEVS
ncbi:hypothetical protein PVK06_022935 [Gossypium arboreum]|uniref:Uncharacterized protein n=1 Tax=Gossypium arboreum TaxID=29729 RepID=A0ABR0PA12_GOSAR|nr:hypothetical protein PVK06_022935 [Gossypium arboreum]